MAPEPRQQLPLHVSCPSLVCSLSGALILSSIYIACQALPRCMSLDFVKKVIEILNVLSAYNID